LEFWRKVQLIVLMAPSMLIHVPAIESYGQPSSTSLL
jgi:hypothetical protein